MTQPVFDQEAVLMYNATPSEIDFSSLGNRYAFTGRRLDAFDTSVANPLAWTCTTTALAPNCASTFRRHRRRHVHAVDEIVERIGSELTLTSSAVGFTTMSRVSSRDAAPRR